MAVQPKATIAGNGISRTGRDTNFLITALCWAGPN